MKYMFYDLDFVCEIYCSISFQSNINSYKDLKEERNAGQLVLYPFQDFATTGHNMEILPTFPVFSVVSV
jgi:hypothetical protein